MVNPHHGILRYIYTMNTSNNVDVINVESCWYSKWKRQPSKQHLILFLVFKNYMKSVEYNKIPIVVLSAWWVK